MTVLVESGAGPPVVFIHPLGADHTFWDPVRTRLHGLRMIAYDLPGHGVNPGCDPHPDLRLWADDLHAVLHQAGHDRVGLVGCSLGGLVAQHFAAGYPDKTAGLVLIDTTTHYGEVMQAEWQRRAAVARAEGLHALVEQTMQSWFTEEFQSHPLALSTRERFCRTDPDGYAVACELLRAADTTGLLAAISAPSLIMCGRHDAEPFLEATTELSAALSGAPVHWLERSKHAGAVEEADQAVAALSTFLPAAGSS